MSDLRRWSEEGATDLEQSLLAEARAESPDPSLRLRTLSALGLGDVLPGGGSGGATQGGVPRSGPGFAAPLAKLAAVGLVAGGAALGLRVFGGDSPKRVPPPPPVESAASLRSPAAVESAKPPSSLAVAEAPPPPVGPRPRRRIIETRQASGQAVADLADMPEGTLLAEVAALEKARGALGARDLDGALAALEAYRREFPGGRPSAEEILLRVRVLLARGERAAAESLARTFVAAHPQSPYVRQLRDLLATKPAP